MTDAQTAQAETPTEPKLRQSPYDQIGGGPVVRAMVDRFYDLMDQDPDYAELRAMHAPDLTRMRDSLTGFLTAWLGGPRDWFIERPGACVMSAHSALSINAKVAGQWTAAMNRAMKDGGVADDLVTLIGDAFARMAQGMTRA